MRAYNIGYREQAQQAQRLLTWPPTAPARATPKPEPMSWWRRLRTG